VSTSISIANARQLNPADVLRKALYDKTEMVDELFPRIPFVPVDGETYQVPMIDIDESLGGFLSRKVFWPTPAASPGESIDTAGVGTAAFDPDLFTDGSGTVARNQFEIRRMVGQVDMNSFTDEVLSALNPQAQMQLGAKLKAMVYEWCDNFYSRSNTANQWTSIDGYIATLGTPTPRQTLPSGVGSGAFSTANAKRYLNELQFVMHMVRGGPDFAVMSDEMLRFFLRSCREVGYAPELKWDAVLNMQRVCFHGVPIYRTQFIQTNTLKQHVYFGRLGEGRGIVGLYPSKLPAPGIKITVVDPDHVKDFYSIRASWNSAIAIPFEGAIARLTDVGIPTEP